MLDYLHHPWQLTGFYQPICGAGFPLLGHTHCCILADLANSSSSQLLLTKTFVHLLAISQDYGQSKTLHLPTFIPVPIIFLLKRNKSQIPNLIMTRSLLNPDVWIPPLHSELSTLGKASWPERAAP